MPYNIAVSFSTVLFLNIPQHNTVAFGQPFQHWVGKNNNGAPFDGYLSDVYFLGFPKDATTFGNSFDGKWGPLASSKVKENIGQAKKGKGKAPAVNI